MSRPDVEAVLDDVASGLSSCAAQPTQKTPLTSRAKRSRRRGVCRAECPGRLRTYPNRSKCEGAPEMVIFIGSGSGPVASVLLEDAFHHRRLVNHQTWTGHPPCGQPLRQAHHGAPGGVGLRGLQIELPAGASTEPHDHLADDVYAIVRGSGWLIVDGHRAPLGVGDFAAVTKQSTRHVIAGEDGCSLIAICA